MLKSKLNKRMTLFMILTSEVEVSSTVFFRPESITKTTEKTINLKKILNTKNTYWW